METIALEFEIYEKFIHSFRLFPDIDLVSKANRIKLGSLKVSLSFCGPVSEPQPMMGPHHENSIKEPASKRKTALSTKSNHSAAKYGKNVAVANKAPVISAPISQYNIDSFVSISQNMKTGEKTFQCSFCGNFYHPNSINRHIRNSHMPSATVFKCQTCDFTGKEKWNLKKHYMNKHKMPEAAALGMLQF